MLDTKKETTSQDKMAEKSRQKQIDKDLIIKAFELLYKQKTSSLEENPQLQTKESEDSHLLTKITNAFDEIDKKENTTDGITIEEKQKVLIDAVKSDPSQQRLKQVNTGQKQPETSLEHTIDQLSKLHQVISKMNNDTFIAFENVLRCVKITSNGQNDMTITQDNLLTQIDAEIAKSQRPAKEPGRGSLRESLIDTVKSLRRAPLQQEQTKQEEATSSPEEATTQQTTKELPLGVKIPQAEK